MQRLIEDIKNSAQSYGSIPFWSWNDKLNPEELRRQIRNMKDLKMNGFFMHARGGLETAYLSDDWYACVEACIDEAKKAGMEAWAYDENGWPSGFAGGKLLKNENYYGSYLKYETASAYPADAQDPAAHILGVYVLKDNRICRIAEADPAAEAEAKAAADSGAQPVYHIIRQGFDTSYVDTLDPDITREFLEITHADYRAHTGKDFGGAMPGFFTDEPQYYRYATPWSKVLPGAFREKYGYDIFSALPAMFIDFDGAEEFRYDYYLLCHQLFINHFVKVIYDWCEENGCQLTGHTVEEACLFGQMWSCGGAMPFYQYEHIPGIDYLGRNISGECAPKQLGSACAQLGKKKALSEMFGCCGWDVTPKELKKIAEFQYVNGVNVMCQHLYAYSIRGQRKRDYPANYSEHLPWQKAMEDFDTYFNHLGAALSRGTESVNTLMIHPIHSAYLRYKRHIDGPSIQELEDHFRALTALLSEHQIPYHYGDEWMMASMASVEGNRLRVGLCTYEYVVVPFAYTLDASTAALLRQFKEAGGKIWLYADAPQRIDGRIADLSWLTATAEFTDLQNAAESRITCGGRNVPALRQMVRSTDSGRIFFITNLTDDIQKDVRITIRGCTDICAIDMLTLNCTRVPAERQPDGSLAVTLTFEAVQSYVLAENPGTAPAPAPAEAFRGTKAAAITLPKHFTFRTPPENALTLDYAQLSYDGIRYEHLRPIMLIKDLLLRQRYRGKIWLKYLFRAEQLPQTLHAAFEPIKGQEITVNGHSLTLSSNWWLDRSFRTADILPLIRTGENEIVVSLDYEQQDNVYYVLYGGVSESLRNCLNFDTEIEAVYLFGRFALKTDSSKFVPSERNSICYDGSFAIIPQKDTVDITDPLSDGYPFFAGALDIETEYEYTDKTKTELYLPGRYAVCEVFVNGTFARRLMFTNHCSLAGLLREGINRIGLKLYNSNRNLLGPHHFADPEPYAVGPVTFSLENCWNGETCDAHRDRYAFVRFGLDL